ncbi:MAG: DNA polymerase III subunit delta' [Actinobacteria bacterium]|nr:DNA polymerase III subunit delta' [Actinomycetota bacterium]MTH91722.1 DNA polymerase III subunit delta' [Actinomycetota bacterium]
MSVFDNLVGQEHVVEIIKNAVAESTSQSMTHAWVFTGPPGSGRSSAAIAFAQALVCPNNGCGTCNACKSTANGAHPDVEIIRTEGLSIKIDEVRELLARVAWAPSMGGWRVVVMEDADRLTESAANALLKAIEEPGNRTVWLLCAPTLHDVLPTIRSRCRHLQLVTPSTTAVAQVLQNRDGISPQMADFAARVSQGHIGRARYLANNESVRNTRTTIMKLPLTLNGISSAFAAAQTLVDLATNQAQEAAEERNQIEIDDLALAYGKGATGRGMATGGSKAIKELEKEQKTRSTRMVRDGLDAALLDIATFYRDVMMVQSGATDSLINKELEHQITTHAHNTKPHTTINKINAIMAARTNLGHNAAPLLTIEALMCVLAR